jgi:hypothetical protein
MPIVLPFIDTSKLCPETPRRTDGDNWKWCQQEAEAVDLLELCKAMLTYIIQNRKRADKNLPVWSTLGEITAHGSGVSAALAERLGFKEQ